jgi:hypothetical protein
MSNGSHHMNGAGGNLSTSETGGSDLEDDLCSPTDILLTCMPMSMARCCCSPCCGGRPSSRAHKHLWINAFVLFLFAVALAGLTYYTVSIQSQLAVLSMHLDPGKPLLLFLAASAARSTLIIALLFL